MLPLRARLLPIVAVLLGAPVTAEMLQAYLPLTGQLTQSLIAMIFLAPLYGGAALLIREVAVRTGQGWSGVLLLAAAFGVAMQALIDLSMFAQVNPQIPYWSELRGPTAVPAWGVSLFPSLSWTMGHVMMSVGAPLALLHALAPGHRGRPLLGRIGIPALVLAGAVIGTQVHIDGRRLVGDPPGGGQMASAGIVVAGLIALALSPLGRQVPGAGRRDRDGADRPVGAEPGRPRVAVVLAAAAAVKICLDLLPPTWIGFGLAVTLVAVSGYALRRVSARRPWGPREIGATGLGLMVGAILIGLAAPLPPGVGVAAKSIQGVLLLAAVAGLGVLVLRRTRRG